MQFVHYFAHICLPLSRMQTTAIRKRPRRYLLGLLLFFNDIGIGTFSMIHIYAHHNLGYSVKNQFSFASNNAYL